MVVVGLIFSDLLSKAFVFALLLLLSCFLYGTALVFHQDSEISLDGQDTTGCLLLGMFEGMDGTSGCVNYGRIPFFSVKKRVMGLAIDLG